MGPEGMSQDGLMPGQDEMVQDWSGVGKDEMGQDRTERDRTE